MRLEQVGRVFSCSFEDGVVIRASHLRELSSGDFRGLLEILDGDVPLHSSMTNLCTATGRQAIVRSLDGTRNNWGQTIDAACGQIIHSLMQGSPTVRICSSDEVAPQRYLLDPILPLNQTTILFGKPGSTKSYVALLLAVLVASPDKASTLGWKARHSEVISLFLDTETTRDTSLRRLQELVRGMGLPPLTIRYKRLLGSLPSELEGILRTILDEKISFVVLDSAGKACGGDITQAGPVNDLFVALDQLGVTVLVIHHQPKDGLTKNRSPYGSAYFEANARSVWHIERAEGSENDFAVCLRHIKSNDSALHRPIGLRVQFGQTMDGKHARFVPNDLRDTEFASELPLRERIVELLGHGPLGVPEIAEALGEREPTVRTRVNEGAKNGTLRKLATGKWGLSTSEEPSIQGTII